MTLCFTSTTMGHCGASRKDPHTFRDPLNKDSRSSVDARLAQILELFAEDSWRMFMRINSKCAHHWAQDRGGRAVAKPLVDYTGLIVCRR